MGSSYWWMLFGMALVTYIPRMIPLTFLDGKELPPVVSGVLRNIPYAVLGALIFPAILFVQEGNILFGILGAGVAFLIAIFGGGVMSVVLGTIVCWLFIVCLCEGTYGTKWHCTIKKNRSFKGAAFLFIFSVHAALSSPCVSHTKIRLSAIAHPPHTKSNYAYNPHILTPQSTQPSK